MARPQRDINRAVQAAKTKAMGQLASWLETRFTEEISAVKWDYPTPPQVRDIVDTGRLRSSLTRVTNNDGSVTFTWPVPYATEVHEGGVALSGLRFPGRPYTKAPLEEASAKFGVFMRAALERTS